MEAKPGYSSRNFSERKGTSCYRATRHVVVNVDVDVIFVAAAVAFAAVVFLFLSNLAALISICVNLPFITYVNCKYRCRLFVADPAVLCILLPPDSHRCVCPGRCTDDICNLDISR